MIISIFIVIFLIIGVICMFGIAPYIALAGGIGLIREILLPLMIKNGG